MALEYCHYKNIMMWLDMKDQISRSRLFIPTVRNQPMKDNEFCKMKVSNITRIQPWMTDSEKECYCRHLSQADALLEYGVGGSTVLAVESGIQSLYCIDTDAAWIARVAKQNAVAKMIARGKARFVHEDLGPVGKWGRPVNKILFYRWPRYARRPWRDGFEPDLVLIDGRFRVSCVMQCLLHGNPETKIVIHDFWNRKRYHDVLRFTSVIDRADSLAVLKFTKEDKFSAMLVRLYYAFDKS